MLSENIRAIRRSKGLSQEELAVKVNVVRQTVSKWENGSSVPDSEMLISLSQALETPVSTLLGETVAEAPAEDLRAISEKLEVINLQLARRRTTGRRAVHWLCVGLCLSVVIIFAVLAVLGSPYLEWDLSDPETAVMETVIHGFVWMFVRVGPVVFVGALVGFFVTMKKDK